MKILQRQALIFAAVATSLGANAELAEQNAEKVNKANALASKMMESVHVYGEREKTTSATKLGLYVHETPQVVSVLSQDQMKDFSLTEANDALIYVPGVTVERVETDRTYYTARGFDIVNFQYDGIGMPFSYGLTQGHDDASIYEQIEVVKGATGLITGLANPSATVNYVRKRPTEETQARVSASAGRWDYGRLEADVSGQLVEDRLQGRLVIAKQKSDSHIDRYSKDLNVFYGILSAEISDQARVNLGHSLNDSSSDGASSGGLPLFYSDGSLTDYDVSTNTAPHWAYQDVEQTRSFVEFEYDLNDSWTAKAIYSHAVQDKEWESFYVSGAPDPVTEAGLVGVASRYEAKDRQDIVDLFLMGFFSAWGQEHELVAGANYADIKLTGRSIYSSAWSGYDDSVGSDWASGSTPRPDMDIFDTATQTTDIDQVQYAYYISTRLNATDNLSFLLGARAVDIEQSGISYAAPQEASVDKVVPYLGATYEAIPGTMLYASYSKVLQAQPFVNADLEPLGAVEGDSKEVGVKQEIYDGNALLTVAYFESHQENYGQWISRDTTTGLNMYQGVEYKSQGIELELAGEVFENLSVSAGYTSLQIDDENGDATRRFVPTKQLKLASSYQTPLDGLWIGAGLRWQNEIYVGDIEVQENYTLLDLFARYQVSERVTLTLNVNNVSDEKYLESPQWGQAIFGEPRTIIGTLTWNY